MAETALTQGLRPSKRPRCGACRWRFDGSCHKRSPWIVAGQVAGGNGHVGIWPEVPADSWCGDFALKVEV